MREMSWEMHFISSAWCILTYQSSSRRYTACVIWRHLPSGRVNVPARLVIVEWMQPAVGYTAHVCLVQFIFNSNNVPKHFLIFCEPFASLAYTLFYCHSYVWMVWSATSIGSLTVQIKRFSSFATSFVACACVHLICCTWDNSFTGLKKKSVVFFCSRLSHNF